jgi:hypothetical protein
MVAYAHHHYFGMDLETGDILLSGRTKLHHGNFTGAFTMPMKGMAATGKMGKTSPFSSSAVIIT